MADQTQKSWVRSASFGLAILSFINLFSYLDRYVVSALIESLKHSELGLSDANLGSLMSGFLVVYTLTAPVFGALGDRRSRPRLIALGVACWSFATALSGFAGSYLALLAARASVGVGEAAYVTIAPSLLSDYFPVRQRGRQGDSVLHQVALGPGRQLLDRKRAQLHPIGGGAGLDLVGVVEHD